jgi:CheY-like chemotaxis protein
MAHDLLDIGLPAGEKGCPMPRLEPEREADETLDIRILMIEGDSVDTTLAKIELERHGCIVQVESHPLKALEKYARFKDSFDLVILDYFMPFLDGGDTVQHLRRLNPDVKVVLFSAVDEIHLRQIMKQYPIDAYIHKPLRVQEALQVIRQFLPALPVHSD